VISWTAKKLNRELTGAVSTFIVPVMESTDKNYWRFFANLTEVLLCLSFWWCYRVEWKHLKTATLFNRLSLSFSCTLFVRNNRHKLYYESFDIYLWRLYKKQSENNTFNNLKKCFFAINPTAKYGNQFWIGLFSKHISSV
jgi:hypothetical protein